MTTFYITTPIYYVNDVPHLGHAYTTIVGDALARYQRCRGVNTRYLTGTDEHGQKIERAAADKQQTPKQLADQVVSRFKATWRNLNINNDDFIRTTDPRHKRVVQLIWQRMADRGDIYLGHYDGLYCVACEEYYTETQLAGETRCPVHNTPVERLQQPSYFFRMSRYQEPLLEHFRNHPDFVRPEFRRNEIVSFISSGLRDLSISRTNLNWGIRAPGDDAHTIYVWMDALTNYVSALDGPDAPLYQAFWPANVHLIGKDILRFHAVYWPCILMSAGIPLPRMVFAHGWWTINGQKMSKTLLNVVEPNTIAADVGRDALRYFLLRETPLGHDGDFSHTGLIQRINADLANDLGNLLNRSLAMAHKYCDSMVPRFADESEAQAVDQAFKALAERVREEVATHFEDLAPSRALESLWELVRGANKYIDTTAPYKLARDPANRRRVEAVVANFLEALRWISLLVAPAMPETALEIRRQLGLGSADPNRQQNAWPARWGDLPEGLQLQRGTPLFPRIDDEQSAALIAKWTGAAEGASPPAERTVDQPGQRTDAAQITIDEFARIDLRVARVVKAEPIEGANRLLKLQLDVGGQQRQVVSGIADAYDATDLADRLVIFVANLKPAKIRGVRSDGMILAAGSERVLALTTLDRKVDSGTRVR